MNYFVKIFGIVGVFSLLSSCGDADSSQADHDEVVGEQGDNGADGKNGSNGEPGQYAALVDQDLTVVGYHLERVDFDENTYEILTIEGYRTVLDLDDASLQPPTDMGGGFGVSCLYESGDCSGDCYGYDTRARGYVLRGPDDSLNQVSSSAASESITAESYNKTNGTDITDCVVGTVALGDAVPTTTYTGILSETLSTPIFFDIVN